MKRPLIIVFAALATIWLAVLPLLVGLYLRAWVPEWTAGWPEAEAVEFRPGWFRSRLAWQSSDGIRLDLRARHAPPLKPGLLRLAGEISTPATPTPARLQGHLGLTGGWHLNGRVADVADSGSLALSVRELELNFAQAAGQPLTLILTAEALGGGQADQAPALGPLRLMARHHQDAAGARHLGIDLNLAAETLGSAGLTLSAGPADAEALADLVDGLLQWSGSPPDSLAQRLALLTVAGAWQQLAASGLAIRLEQLHFGRHTRLSGQWQPPLFRPDIRGAGAIAELIDWYAALAVGLIGKAPDQAELEARAWLITLAQHGWLRFEDDRFRVQSPAEGEPRP